MKCKEGWLKSYLEYTKYSESPERFHLWTGISVIAATLGRKVYWDLGYEYIYPNLYVVLVAKSAGLKKTAACAIGVDLLYLLPKPVEIIADKLTSAYVLTHLGEMAKKGEDSVAFIYAEELSVFIGPNALSSGLIATLTKLYNCPKFFPYRTKTSGSWLLTNCCLGLFGASTPEWLSLSMPSDALGGGFWGRMLLVTAIEKERCVPHPKKIMPPKGALGEIRRNLLDDLSSFQELEGEFEFDKEADKWHDKWYRTRAAEVDTDPRLTSYFERRHITLVKLSMILAIARGSRYVICRGDLEEGLRLLFAVEETLIHAYEGITFSESTKHMDRVKAQIERAGTIDKSKLLKVNWGRLDSKELYGVINTLKDAGLVEEIASGRTTFYNYIGGKK